MAAPPEELAGRRSLAEILEAMKSDPDLRANITAWRVLEAQPAETAPLPTWLDPRLADALRSRGIAELYRHQADAVEAVRAGRDVTVVTPTASGKTLCYNLPVLQRLLEEPEARAIYLFPTKALAQDQLAELHRLVDALGADIRTYTYDGDTPGDARRAIRQAGHVVVTNPDMLHTGILPHHPRWVRLFENLRYVVVDELHQYRGVFGSHVANVLRRLQRICRFYGAGPLFICCSATIANPGELAERLTGRPMQLVDRSGAPRGTRHFLFYNPPVINRQLGIRKSALLEARRLAERFLRRGVPTIVFAQTRLAVEVLVTYLKSAVAGRLPGSDRIIRGYRGGYLPTERRAIEAGLRDGSVRGVVSTNALELGIDIGQLDACVMAGYPGSVASTWQRAGRAGRRTGTSAVVLVATSSPLDQYIVTHPDYFFGQPAEEGRIDPDNPLILLAHLKCAAFELPFRVGEAFGAQEPEPLLAYLEQHGVLHRAADTWHWMAEQFPAEDVSLRSATAENVVIVDETAPRPRVIGEVDRWSAPTLVHEEAIYLHESRQYQVKRLDWEGKKAYVREVDVDYYTDASLAVALRVIDEFRTEPHPPLVDARAPAEVPEPGHPLQPAAEKGLGEVLVTAKATMFKKIKFETHENLGSGPIHLPEQELHTTAAWLAFGPAATAGMDPPAIQGALSGAAHVLANVAPLYLLCDRNDLRAVPETRSSHTQRPTVTLYDRVPGGVGLAEAAYRQLDRLAAAGVEVVRACGCEAGCPSCVGPTLVVGPDGKRNALRLLRVAAGGVAGAAPAGPVSAGNPTSGGYSSSGSAEDAAE